MALVKLRSYEEPRSEHVPIGRNVRGQEKV